jgi:hypothetical protein
MRSWIAVLGLALALTSGCVSRTAEPPDPAPAGPTTSAVPPATSTSARPTAVTPDAAIAAEAADILASGDAARFTERICPGTRDIPPVASIGPEYAGTRPAGIGSHHLPVRGDSVVARLTVRPGEADLMLVLGLDFDTYEWCAYTFEWCPIDYGGLAPFTVPADGEPAVVRELNRTVLCGR